MKPKLSVIIPSYNEEKSIEACVRSLSRQAFPRKDYEIVLVDAHSKDRTVEIAEKYVDRVVYDEGKGYTFAKNLGAKVAKADIIVFTDADTLVPSNWLSRIYAYYKDPAVIAVGGLTFAKERKPAYRRIVFNFVASLARLTAPFGLYHLPTPNCSYKKKFFFKAGGFPPFPATDDFYLSQQIKKLGKVVFDPSLIVYTSTRRLEKLGIWKTYWIWFLGVVGVLSRGKPLAKKYKRLT